MYDKYSQYTTEIDVSMESYPVANGQKQHHMPVKSKNLLFYCSQSGNIQKSPLAPEYGRPFVKKAVPEHCVLTPLSIFISLQRIWNNTPSQI